MSDLYRLVYTSQNLLRGSEGERATTVAEILATSQRNNRKVGVSGALLFNGGSFAQVLEGPRHAVEATFERIQRDPRHSEVSVLQCEAVEERGFPNWSMAFVGHSARGRALWNDIAERTGFDPSRIDGDQLFATLHAIVVEEEGLTDDALSVPLVPVVASAPADPRREALDVERLRADLLDRTPGTRPGTSADVRSAETVVATLPTKVAGHPGRTAPEVEGVVLRAALAAERQRTTDLRCSLDEARIALAVASDELAIVRRHRDIWTERAKALASALCREPAITEESATEDERGAELTWMKAVG